MRRVQCPTCKKRIFFSEVCPKCGHVFTKEEFEHAVRSANRFAGALFIGCVVTFIILNSFGLLW